MQVKFIKGKKYEPHNCDVGISIFLNDRVSLRSKHPNTFIIEIYFSRFSCVQRSILEGHFPIKNLTATNMENAIDNLLDLLEPVKHTSLTVHISNELPVTGANTWLGNTYFPHEIMQSNLENFVRNLNDCPEGENKV